MERGFTPVVTTLADSGTGSLRQAIADANPGETITFAVTGVISLTTGQLTIDKDLTIRGPGAELLAISGNNASRVIEVAAGAEVLLSGVTIRDGLCPNEGDNGCGILNAGQLTVRESAIQDNGEAFKSWSESSGAGIYNSGSLDIMSSSISHNAVGENIVDGGGAGGGIYNGGTLRLSDSMVVSNTGYGGGIANQGTAVIYTAVITGNIPPKLGVLIRSYMDAGGVLNEGSMTLDASTVSNNQGFNGGGIYNTGSLTVTSSTLSGNLADGGWYAGSGGGIYSSGLVQISNSTISNNSALSNEVTDVGGGGIASVGSATLVITSSTIVNNTAPGGSGIHSAATAPVALHSTIMADNRGTNPANPGTNGSGRFVAEATNLIENTSGMTLTGNLAGVLTGQNPRLGPLADNGGPTLTHLPQPGSPAIDAVPMDACTTMTDQRGVARPQGVRCDLGAVEVATLAPPPAVELAPGASLLALYALAFDTPITSTMSLAPFFTETVQSIITATLATPHITAVVLADLDQVGDTRIIVVNNGITTTLTGLPDGTGRLNPALTEYNMADGATLGNFIAWARAAYPTNRTLFAFAGHGTAFAPETDVAQIFDPQGRPLQVVIPTPHRKGSSDFTDVHPMGLISPRDLQEALRRGSNNGQQPVDVVDLIHCFAGTVEQLYPVYPYVRTVTASPNYAYFAPTMPGAALQALRPGLPVYGADGMAARIVRAYDILLPATEHPRLLVAIDTSRLSAVKATWDTTAYYLMQQLSTDQATTRQRLLTAYEATDAYYDTTFCGEQDWKLAAPDALVDMALFAQQVAVAFGTDSDVGRWASATEDNVRSAIIARYAREGVPWFVDATPRPTWRFPGAGLALYADFVGVTVNDTPFLSWQLPWYLNTALTNPQRMPLSSLLQGGTEGTTWATVVQGFWAGEPRGVAACLPFSSLNDAPGLVLQGVAPGEERWLFLPVVQR